MADPDKEAIDIEYTLAMNEIHSDVAPTPEIRNKSLDQLKYYFAIAELVRMYNDGKGVWVWADDQQLLGLMSDGQLLLVNRPDGGGP